MADKTHIEWTDATWNPVTGCSIVSPGCTHCYAMKLAGTRLKHIPSRIGLTTMTKAGPVWNGTVRFNPGWLLQPISWRKPRNIFVCAHGDLFHEDVPDEWIDKVFAVMAMSPHHTFQVLTKRSARMRSYLQQQTAPGRQWAFVASHGDSPETRAAMGRLGAPLPNVWLGVSTERQKEANERIPDLLATPAAVRFISAEPLLGPLDLTKIMRQARGDDWAYCDNALTGFHAHKCGGSHGPKLDWIIVGGESGDKARSMHPQWARDLRDQCAKADMLDRFFFKQWGQWAPSTPEQAASNPRSGWQAIAGHPHVAKAHELYPDAGAAFVEHMTKSKAGRLLDGVEHNGMPGGAL
jgi:protein gp37